MIDPVGFTVHGLAASLFTAAALTGRSAWLEPGRLDRARTTLMAAGLRPIAGHFEGPIANTPVRARIVTGGGRCRYVEIEGMQLPRSVPFVARRPAALPRLYWEAVSGDPDFDRQVIVGHIDADRAFTWTGGGRRRAVLEAIRYGARLVERRWRVQIPFHRVDRDLWPALHAIGTASRGFRRPPDTDLRPNLHAMTHDACVHVRIEAARRMKARDELPESVVNRMQRSPEPVERLASLMVGGRRAVEIAERIFRTADPATCFECALRIAALCRSDPYAWSELVEEREKKLVSVLFDMLAAEQRVPEVVEALRGLERVALLGELYERFGDGGGPVVRALMRENGERYRERYAGEACLTSALGREVPVPPL